MSEAFDELFARARGAFRQQRVFERARVLAKASCIALGRHTITGALMTAGRQFDDWSAAYRLFGRERFEASRLFDVSRRVVLEALAPNAPLHVVLDDTVVPKRGRKVAQAAWRHNPHGPAFQHQIVWAQRLVELAALLPSGVDEPCSARAVAIDVALQPVVPRAPRTADERQRAEQEHRRRACTLPNLAADRLAALRRRLDADGEQARRLVVAVDGGYTNKTLLRAIPPSTTVIGRLRKDAKLFAPPAHEEPGRRGRKRLYGDRIATPEQLLADTSVPWSQARAFVAGEVRTFDYKTVTRCRWSGSGGRDVRLVVVRPLSRTPHARGRRLLFAHPGYLLCTEPELDVAEVLQSYAWRWEIEVSFREQKTQLGVGEAQTRTPAAVASVLELGAFVHGLVVLASHRSAATTPPRPKWQSPPKNAGRVTFGQMISTLRCDLWGRALGLGNKTGFAVAPPRSTKPPELENTLCSAVIYAAR